MDEQLQQLIELQKEQNQLLKRYLWRLRFSLLGLLLMTTAVAVGLGMLMYRTHVQPPAPIALPFPLPPADDGPSPVGDIQVNPTVPGTS